jgi:hypothetical protein
MNHENQSREPRTGGKQLDDMMNTDGDVVTDKWSMDGTSQVRVSLGTLGMRYPMVGGPKPDARTWNLGTRGWRA